MITTASSLMVIEGNPWAKKRPRVSKGGKRTHQDPADKAAEDETRKQLREQWGNRPPWSGNIKLYVAFYRKNRQVVDIDNLLKHLQDSGNEIVWGDDRQITGLGQVDMFVDPDNPRTTFYVMRHQTNLTR